jgi:hypothetical protein
MIPKPTSNIVREILGVIYDSKIYEQIQINNKNVKIEKLKGDVNTKFYMKALQRNYLITI